MTDHDLQLAIDKTRAWLSAQLDYKTTPSHDARDHAVKTLKELQSIQVTRAGMATMPMFRKVEDQ